MTSTLFAAISLTLSLALARTLVHASWPRALAEPNQRSLHAGSVPKTGGIAIVAALGVLGFFAQGLGLMVGIALALAVVSILDDVARVSIAIRFATHLAAGIAFSASVLWAHGLLVCAIAALGVAWATNLYNFMDGMDGFAGGMTLAGFGTYSAVAWLEGDAALGLLCLVLAAGALGFLAFNFPPARIFLGDVGSIPLGFLAGAVGLVGWKSGSWPLWFPPVLFGPFVVDATATLLRRLLRRERVWEAHREHYYQRLVRMGWSHRRALLCEYVLMAATVLVAVSAADARSAVAILLLAGLATVYVLLMILVDRRWRRFAQGRAPEPRRRALRAGGAANGSIGRKPVRLAEIVRQYQRGGSTGRSRLP
jgi:UDP-N-acetylmuramyl pentapeptide phosphotransferase/UDP-N-acetylglucosamine-1-phosphate transferase